MTNGNDQAHPGIALLSDVRCPTCNKLQVRLKHGTLQAKCERCKTLYMAVKAELNECVTYTVSPSCNR